ncbi:hypothetical protein [Actinoplanes sp. NPDC051411]|uniref:hypothetical protein n=1 Tax=Actinoplanes sp. NPDC051411 TaxID=3155522 RepID=UPI003448590E
MSEVDWSRYNLPAISSLIADVDVCDGADRVLAWEGLTSTVRDQHTRLLAAADSLAAVWPPGKNDSALEFQRQVKGLADSMQETLKKAEDTRAGLNGVVQAFSTAQSRMRDLAAGREGVANDWVPRMVDHAEDKYDERAQAAMREAEAAISDHGAQIQAPGLFQMRPAIGDDGHHLSGDDAKPSSGTTRGDAGGGGLRATPIPVPVDRDPSGVSSDSPAEFGSNGAGPGGSGQFGPGTAGSSNDGPVLSGLAPTGPSAEGASGPAIGGGPATGIGLPPGTPVGGSQGQAGVLPIGGGVPAGAGGLGGGFVGGLPGGASGTRRPVSVRRAMPSGAVIGESTERGVGGNQSGVAGAMPIGGAGGRGAGRRGSGGTIDGQANQQWATGEGVAPVIQPETNEVRHDPGPGVIGFDR